MKNLMISLLLGIGLIGSTAQAEEISVPEFAAIFQLSTSDQASVAAAFTRFAASDCRKSMPTAIRIMRETFNGTEDISHSVIWNFVDTEALTQTFASFQCREWADVAAVLSQQAEFKSQQLVRTLATGGDYTKDTAYIVWQMAISDEAAYVDAYNDLMEAQTRNGLITGAYGLWRVQGGANDEVTHIAFAGADSLATLLSNSNPSKAFVAFQRKVAGIRTVHRQNINAVLAEL
jgi:hypothetical protein